jgi:hypothetical protein
LNVPHDGPDTCRETIGFTDLSLPAQSGSIPALGRFTEHRASFRHFVIAFFQDLGSYE